MSLLTYWIANFFFEHDVLSYFLFKTEEYYRHIVKPVALMLSCQEYRRKENRFFRLWKEMTVSECSSSSQRKGKQNGKTTFLWQIKIIMKLLTLSRWQGVSIGSCESLSDFLP